MLGLNLEDLYRMDLREYINLHRGFNRRLEIDERRSWEQTRLIIFYLVNVNLTSNSQVSLGKIMSFPWDKDRPENKPLSEEAKKRMEELFPKNFSDIEHRFSKRK